MIKVSVLYPYREGYRFDFDYYCAKHMPLVRDRLGAACQGIAVDRGVAGGAPGTPPPYVAMANLFFDSIDAFQTAFAPHADAILADVANYTDLQPELMFSDVLINAGRGETEKLHQHHSG